jgi:hypothetical protein
MQSLLSDGATAVLFQVSSALSFAGAVPVDGRVWMLAHGEKFLSIRNPKTGEVISKIDLLDEGVALGTAQGRVWVATKPGKLYVLGSDGILLGVLQPGGIPTVTAFHSVAGHHATLLTSGGGKDFHRWDATQFLVERTYFGRIPGEVVTCVVSANHEASAFIASTTMSIRLWSLDGSVLAEVHEGATSVVALFNQSTGDSNGGGGRIWSSQQGWITIFVYQSSNKATTFQRERTIPCAGVLQLLRTTPKHICAFDSEGLITIWHSDSAVPLRSFKVGMQGGFGSPGNHAFCSVVQHASQVVLWTVGEGKGLVWCDEHADDPLHAAADGDNRDLEREEVLFLRRKLKHIEGMATLYRQKMAVLFREKPPAASGASPARLAGSAAAAAAAAATMQSFNEIDTQFAEAISSWEHDEEEPLPDGAGRAGSSAAPADAIDNKASDFTEYWKHKYYELMSELSRARKENENIVELLHSQAHSSTSGGSAADTKRAFHICEIIREKNELKEREAQYLEDISRLRGKLREYGSPLGSATGPAHFLGSSGEASVLEVSELRKEISKLRAARETDQQALLELQQQAKQSQLLKQRVKKLKAELDQTQIDCSASVTQMQSDISALIDAVNTTKQQLEAVQIESASALSAKNQLEVEQTKLNAALEHYTAAVGRLERELSQRDAVDQNTDRQLKQEVTMLCQSLDDRDKKILELSRMYAALVADHRDAEQQRHHLEQVIESKNTEIFALEERNASLDAVVNDRRTYARTVMELQGRMELVVEELRHSFTPAQFSSNISSLEQRVSNLFAVEAQLRQKDDIIAVKDDEIQQLREHAAQTEKHIQEVSAVFSKLPRSVEEIEELLVEVDEYRRRLQNDPEVQEMLQIRLLELQARRRVTEQPPVAMVISETPAAVDGSVLADVTLASSVADKTGLLKTPR